MATTVEQQQQQPKDSIYAKSVRNTTRLPYAAQRMGAPQSYQYGHGRFNAALHKWGCESPLCRCGVLQTAHHVIYLVQPPNVAVHASQILSLLYGGWLRRHPE